MMKVDVEIIGRVCEEARVRGRGRQVLELLAQEVAPAEVAERLGIAVATVHVHAHRAKLKIARSRARDELRELYRFLLEEGMKGPLPSNPAPGLYRVTGPGEGERVRVSGGPMVTVEELM